MLFNVLITIYALALSLGCLWSGPTTLVLTAYDYAWLYPLAVILFGFNNFFVIILAWSRTVSKLLIWTFITTALIYTFTLLAYFSGGFIMQEALGALVVGIFLTLNYFGIRHIYLRGTPNNSSNLTGAENAPPS